MVTYGLRGIIVTMDYDGVIRDGAVIIDSNSGLIIDVGESKIIRDYKPEVILGDGNSIIMPGLINTHTHSPMSIFRGLISGVSGFNWLERVWRLEGSLKPMDVYIGALTSIACMIRSGTTTFSDHYFYAEEIVKAVEETGIRAVIAKAVVEYSKYAPKHSLKDSLSFAMKYMDACGGRVKTMIGIHSLYSCSLDTVREAVESSEAHGIPIHIHLAESRDELNYINGMFKVTPVKLAFQIGLLKTKPLTVHVAYVDEGEISLMAKCGVKVAYAPFTKLRGGQEITPIIDMLKNGVKVSLATDSPLSCGDLDMFREMKFALAAQNYKYHNPSALNPMEIVELATIRGAENLGLNGITGSIRRGKMADVILLKPDVFRLMPITDIYYTIVYCLSGGDVDSVFVSGKPLMINGRLTTININELMEKFMGIVERYTSI